MGSVIQSGKLGPELGRGTELRSSSLSWRWIAILGELNKQRIGEDTHCETKRNLAVAQLAIPTL